MRLAAAWSIAGGDVAVGVVSTVEARANGVRQQGVTVSRVQAHLHGVHLSSRDAPAGRLRSVGIDRADGSALLRYGDLNSLLQQALSGVVPGGTAVGGSGCRTPAVASPSAAPYRRAGRPCRPSWCATWR
jgi:hypothetical protein